VDSNQAEDQGVHPAAKLIVVAVDHFEKKKADRLEAGIDLEGRSERHHKRHVVAVHKSKESQAELRSRETVADRSV